MLFFLPIIGFVLYLLLGRNLQKKHFIRWHTVHQKETKETFKTQQQAFKENRYEFPNAITKKHAQLIQMNLNYNHALLSSHNDVQLLTDGEDKFTSIVQDIIAAKEHVHVHVQYYIFKMDTVGTRIYEALLQKAREGVEVRVIYDDLGSRKLKKKHFKELIEAGGEVEAFFSSYFTLLNPRINFRNHRRLAIVDGTLGYIGGFNVGNEYASLDEKKGYWRDTHLRNEGHSVYSMQAHFLFDWHQARNESFTQHNEEKYFPKFETDSTIPVQVVSSGPDTDFESIKDSYIRMILSAKKYVYIESPYFVPDEAFYSALTIAASSGVDVRVITPAVPDHPFVYGDGLLEHGGRVYRDEKGFLHAKMMVVDDELVTICTTNIDVRSFSLNFEINAIVFDEDFVIQCRQAFEEDEQESFEMTKERYAARPLWTKVREAVSKLLSPLLSIFYDTLHNLKTSRQPH